VEQDYLQALLELLLQEQAVAEAQGMLLAEAI
jgi:hypothetical protein